MKTDMDKEFKSIVDSLKDTRNITRDQFAYLLKTDGEENKEYLFEAAREVLEQVFH